MPAEDEPGLIGRVGGRPAKRRALRVAACRAAAVAVAVAVGLTVGPGPSAFLGASGAAAATRTAPKAQGVKRSASHQGRAPHPTRAAGSAGAVANATVGPVAYQTIDGFGASGAWWPSQAAHFPTEEQRRIGQLLFGSDGLALSQYRYNIGGGGVGVNVAYKVAADFLAQPGGYDWGRDADGMTFLRMANSYHVPALIGFVNSAPARWTTNHRSCGGALIPGAEAAFAGYLAGVVAHLQQEGIQLAYVSPMNEPDTSQAPCHQEGMRVPVAQRATLVVDLARALRAAGLHTGVIADESSLVGQMLAEAPGWLPAATPSVAAFAHHTYDYRSAAALAPVAALPVRHWATEICCYNGVRFGFQYDPTMTSGLWLANTIYGDLASAHDSAFDWWVALSPNVGCDPVARPGCESRVNPMGRNDGLVYFDAAWATDHNHSLYLTKRYWVMAQFSRFVHPGSVVHLVSGLGPDARAVAFDQGHRWVVVALNSASAPGRVQLHLPLPASQRVTSSSGTVTDDARNMARIGVQRTGRDVLSLTLPARSVTTLVAQAR
ncbi:MAG TPA: glycoside hydrolase [Acidimicrobiales bacterium]|nr:glycoside hydrolase [Acidimicrobiales bacterium]